MDLDKLILEESELREKLSRNLNEQRLINSQTFCAKYGIWVGDIIEFMDGKEKVTGVFDHIEYSGVKVNYVWVNLFNSDGKVGKRTKRCWWSGLETLKLVKSNQPSKG